MGKIEYVMFKLISFDIYRSCIEKVKILVLVYKQSIIFLLNFPGFGPKWPPSDGVGLHGSLTIVNHPDPFEFMVRLPSSASIFAVPSLLSPKINSG